VTPTSASPPRPTAHARSTVPWLCARPGRRPPSNFETFYEQGAAIRPDGTFRIVNTYTERYADGPDRGRVVIEGRFVPGGAIGTVQMSSVQRSRRDNRPIFRCRSGKHSWVAAV
jgi:hypothetical protein